MTDELDRRAFLRRLAKTAAFAVPLVTSFSMTSVGQAFGATERDGDLDHLALGVACNSLGGSANLGRPRPPANIDVNPDQRSL